ncbi:MAG: tRNA (adenosine(37)-N6)-threonylcarbamoyltransferase complex transferase subunit TsaD [Ruminococcaceae bacterium]|nr:tRNA (adenosine(37)-N6)-threonylcarbamoyltransferase complex transferase subunit TsaD [Oscillospiraceae bacterium]
MSKIILAIESSCDETSAAVVKDGRTVLSNVVLSQIDIHKKYGGVVPEIASRAHTEAISHLAKQAIEQSGVTFDDIDAVAATSLPGLIGALLVGVSFAKALAYSLSKPFVPVNHIRGHIAAGYLAHEELKPPFCAAVLSGGHTSIIGVDNYTSFRVLGCTRDDAAGEAFDKTARIIGIPYPGGKEMDELAASAKGCGNYEFPSPIVKDSPFEFSFSGLKTAVINRVHNDEQKGIETDREALACAFTKAVISGITTRLENVLNAYPEYTSLLLCGGVSANSHIRKAAEKLCKKKKISFYVPPLSLCGDNAAMIGSQAFYEFAEGNVGGLDHNPIPDSEV